MSRRVEWGGASARGLVAAIALAAAAGLAGCRQETRGGGAPGGPPPTPGPQFPLTGTPDHGKVLGYARGLEYDREHGAGETRRLMVGCPPGACRYGPLVRLEPEVGVVSLSKAQLAEGRVLARMINLDTAAYPKLGLGPRPDTAYWLVRDSAGLRSWYVSSDPRRPIAGPDTFRINEYPHARGWTRTIARFVFTERDEGLWVPCIVFYCCQTTDSAAIQ